ncbi:MAG: hypothetical protein ABIG71_00125 [Candidatus Uhrbacteria bacterium]
MFAYLLTLHPPVIVPSAYWAWLTSALVLLIIGIAIRSVFRRRKLAAFELAPWRRLSRGVIVIGVTLWCLLFLRYEQVPLFAARFWLALVIIGGLAWLFLVARQFLVIVPRRRRERDEKMEKEKYLK